MTFTTSTTRIFWINANRLPHFKGLFSPNSSQLCPQFHNCLFGRNYSDFNDSNLLHLIRNRTWRHLGTLFSHTIDNSTYYTWLDLLRTPSLAQRNPRNRLNLKWRHCLAFLLCRVYFCTRVGGQPGLGFADIPAKGYAPRLVTISIHTLGAAMDVEADIAAGQRTIAT